MMPGSLPRPSYAAIGNKQQVLRRVVEARLLSDPEVDSMQDRWLPRLAAPPDPHGRIRVLAALIRDAAEGLTDLRPVIHAAVQADEEFAQIFADADRARLEDARMFLSTVHDTTGGGFDLDWAADTLWAIAGDDVYDALTLRLGWTADDFERWLEDLLTRLLLTSPET